MTAYADKPLDEIEDYTIQVDMRPDGTMDIRYHIEWKVLDSESDGLLEWVKIGCPNKHVDQITALSDNIKEIKYISDGGSYIRIDFDRKYERNETVTFDYTIHQSYMYIIEEENHLCRYSFTPGWFDEIEVKHITIRWEKANVLESTAQREEEKYLIWEGSLLPSERLNASVKYNLDVFTTNENEQYTEDSGGVGLVALIVVIIVLIVLISIIMVMDDGYNGGFGGGGHFSGGSRSCACVSHCACACACAGGGRAGCSKKDFYHTKLQTDIIKSVLIDQDDNDKKQE